MSLRNWNKVENEAGYPTFIDEVTGTMQYNHPQFQKIMECLEEYDDIKYNAYRIAFKIFAIQKHVRVPPLRISSGVFARHQLSLSETSLSLDTIELEAVLADIYFAAEKEGLFTGDINLAVDLIINLLLNIYDKERKEPVRVLAAKTLLIVLSEEDMADKWAALSNSCADHNGCVSPKRLVALLTHLAAIPAYLGTRCDRIQVDVDACFEKSAGMLGVTARCVAEWAAAHCASARWLAAVQRVTDSRNSADVSSNCAACLNPLIQVLKFKCSKCTELYFCEKCYLYDNHVATVPGHKKSHPVYEIVDGEAQPRQCISLIKSMRKFFFCTKTKKKKISRKGSKTSLEKQMKEKSRRKGGKPAMFTSTVGKASGHNAGNPAAMLQDIIAQLETQNRALKELSSELEKVKTDSEDGLKTKVETHLIHITTQISRLKLVKENLSLIPQASITEQKLDSKDRPQAFDLFSPIPVEETKQSKVSENMKSEPRTLSMDSGNSSVVSKQPSLFTVSGDALKPVANATTDTISTISMNDISYWYKDSESLAPDKQVKQTKPSDKPILTKPSSDPMSQSLAATERQFAADISSVENSNDKMKEWNADIDMALDRLQQILTNNLMMDDSNFDNTQFRETATEMEGLLGTLIRGVEQRATMNSDF